jgi:hypothetical protein
MKAAGTRVRKLVSDLKATLKEIGMEDVLIRNHRQLSIRPALLDCDYYRFLEGDMEAVNAYSGVYMEDYSWAEMTTGQLVFPKQGTRLAPVRPDQAGPRSLNSSQKS